jgi:excisionase family DNA binding protein
MRTKKPANERPQVHENCNENEVSETTADLANKALCDLNEILGEQNRPSREVRVAIQGSGRVVTLPRELGEVLRQILANTAAGQMVGVIPAHAELTTQQAADMLNVSRPFIIKLIENGVLEYRKVGTHRRIKASSVRDYARRMELDSRNAADELAALTEDLELY